MQLKERIQELKSSFSLCSPSTIAGSKIKVFPFSFEQSHQVATIRDMQQGFSGTGFCSLSDDQIQENKTFNYTIFTPEGKKQYRDAILLLHGLNERAWDKYLPWAEYLTMKTRKPVILFPIAFHMNRAPELWSNPRKILPWVKVRKEESPETPNTTFANVALSARIAQNPLRFYSSGLETIFNIEQLIKEIKEGRHPLFREDTSVNIFAYSIGAYISEISLIANRKGLFSDTKLFMFCGGSLMSHMDGSARDIMDQKSYRDMQSYYVDYFVDQSSSSQSNAIKDLTDAFRIMIREDKFSLERESFFLKARNRIRGITLRQDTVIPTLGVAKAFGSKSSEMLQEIDFTYPYSHQIPFPTTNEANQALVDQAFCTVFNQACSFLA